MKQFFTILYPPGIKVEFLTEEKKCKLELKLLIFLFVIIHLISVIRGIARMRKDWDTQRGQTEKKKKRERSLIATKEQSHLSLLPITIDERSFQDHYILNYLPILLCLLTTCQFYHSLILQYTMIQQVSTNNLLNNSSIHC